MNTNLSIELEHFEADRINKFKRILGCRYYSEKRKVDDIEEFISIEAKNFSFLEKGNIDATN